MKHAYLFQPGRWLAQGHYVDDAGKTFGVEGESQVTHELDVWRVENVFILHSPKRPRVTSSYEIVPFLKGELTTPWVAYNPGLGKLFGRFTLVEDAILSFYHMEGGSHEGFETLLKLEEGAYASRGCAFEAGERLSSWALTLTLQK